ncbi:MAG: hypothetical protein AAFR89_03355, partial [Cyanobacteria bacterium J06633_1]
LGGPKVIRDGLFIEIHYPSTYRNTGKITHLPTQGTIRSWLKIVGFSKIDDSDCYHKFNRNLIGLRYACISKKEFESNSDSYYKTSGDNPKYGFGEST